MNGIETIKQVFPPELLKRIQEEVGRVPFHYGWHSNRGIEYTHWNYSFAKAGADNSLDVSDQISGVIKEAWDYLQANHIGPQALLRCYVNAHTYGIEGYPHTDSSRALDKTILVYLTPNWQINWGGETVVYKDGDILHAELPRENKGLIFPGAQLHCARAVTRICPALRLTLMFKYAPIGYDTTRDNIQRLLVAMGTHKTKHSKNNLKGHLLRTYDRLRAKGYSTTICAAGALHSIFGTNAFKTATLGPEAREPLVKMVGEEVVRLVELFRDIKRPSTLENALAKKTLTVETNSGSTIELTPDQLNSLCAIEAANLLDQNTNLAKYPHLSRIMPQG